MNAIERIQTSLKKTVIVVFMKGTPKHPFDGYQEEAIRILIKQKVRFMHFDVLGDPDVREILKEYSRFSAFPQVFCHGKFLGGLNFLRETEQKGGLASYVPSTEVLLPMQQKIALMITKGELMIFLNGTLEVPQCEASQILVDLLMSPPYSKLKEKIATFDLGTDSGIKQALIEYSHLNQIP